MESFEGRVNDASKKSVTISRAGVFTTQSLQMGPHSKYFLGHKYALHTHAAFCIFLVSPHSPLLRKSHFRAYKQDCFGTYFPFSPIHTTSAGSVSSFLSGASDPSIDVALLFCIGSLLRKPRHIKASSGLEDA